MCQRPASVVALALALSVVSATPGQEQIKPVEIKKVSNEDGLTLGNGVSLDRISPAYSSPFKELKVSREKNADPVASIRMHLVTTAKALDAETGINVEAKARVLFARRESGIEFSRASSISEESFRLVLIGESKYGHDELREPKLKREAAALIKAGQMDEFSKIYGTHFVLREHRIARIALTISVDRWSDKTLQRLHATSKGGASLPLVAGELKASIQSDLREASKRKALNVELSTTGGTGLQGFGEIVKALVKGLLANSSDFETDVGQALESLLKGFTRENSGIGSVTVASYKEYGFDPNKLNLWNELFEDKLQKCADLYYAGRQVERSIRRFATPNANPSLKKKLEDYAGKYDGYLAQLADFQKALLAKDQDYVKKKFPNEPEIDPETARALFARFNTLESRINELNDELKSVKSIAEIGSAKAFIYYDKRGVISQYNFAKVEDIGHHKHRFHFAKPPGDGYVVLVSAGSDQLSASAVIENNPGSFVIRGVPAERGIFCVVFSVHPPRK